jgi:hypothetical protein
MQEIGFNLQVAYCFRTAVTARRFESFSNPAGETGVENDNRIDYLGVGSRIAKTFLDGLRRQGLSGIRHKEAHDRYTHHITTQ